MSDHDDKVNGATRREATTRRAPQFYGDDDWSPCELGVPARCRGCGGELGSDPTHCRACYEARKLGQLPLATEHVEVGHAPDWYTPSPERRTANKRVTAGYHPMGMALGPADETCGSCVHLYANRLSKDYLKCALVPATGGPATDVRKKWRACERWASSATS